MRVIAAVLGALLALSSTSVRADELQVTVASGALSGFASRDGLVRSFKGIPYAAPPVGALTVASAPGGRGVAGDAGGKSFRAHLSAAKPNPGRVLSAGVLPNRGGAERGLPLSERVDGGACRRRSPPGHGLFP